MEVEEACPTKLTMKRIKVVFDLETGCDAINAFMCRKRQIYLPAVKPNYGPGWAPRDEPTEPNDRRPDMPRGFLCRNVPINSFALSPPFPLDPDFSVIVAAFVDFTRFVVYKAQKKRTCRDYNSNPGKKEDDVNISSEGFYEIILSLLWMSFNLIN